MPFTFLDRIASPGGITANDNADDKGSVETLNPTCSINSFEVAGRILVRNSDLVNPSPAAINAHNFDRRSADQSFANAARGTGERGAGREKIIIDKSMSVIRFVAYRAERRLRLESLRREKSKRDGRERFLRTSTHTRAFSFIN
jgi:hypothetical protein